MTEPRAGRYEILEALGAGGMGVIYRAHDPSLDRDVALKFLSDASATDATARLRLLREARTVATLNHPNIAVVHEIDEEDGRLFMAMELVDGESLQRRIGPHGIVPAVAIDYGIQVADALDHAHSRGVVHRDLKSANVMVTPEGRVKLLDFGIARMLADAGETVTTKSADFSSASGSGPGPTLTVEGTVLGTPQYLPPEVIRGDAADSRSDLWSLGVLMYEMVTGRLPFSAGSMRDLALAIVNREPEPLPVTLSQGLRSVIARCLAKDPDRRYQHASEVRAALEAVRDSGAATIVLPRRVKVHWRVRAFVMTLLIATLGGVAALVLTGRLTPNFGGSGLDPGNIRSLAVLPLANLSGDASQDYFADGMTEELITRLASIDSLKVISRTSVMGYRNTTRPLRQIAKELGVDGIVEGSCVRAGNRVKITAQLIDAASDRHLWAESYERDMKDVLALQSDVAQDIAAKVRLNLTAAERARMGNQPIRNAAAYENYLQGRAAWSQVSESGMRAAIGYFQRAIALDSTDARSYAGLADSYLLLTQVLGTVSFQEGLPKVRRYAERALALDPDLAEANTSKAIAQIWIDHDWAGAEHSLKRAFDINPGYAPAYIVEATLLGILGRLDDAVAAARHAIALDPNSTIAHFGLAWQFLLAENYDGVVSEVAAIQRMDPTHYAATSLIARVAELRGDYARAVEVSRTDHGWAGEPPPTEALRRGLATGGPHGYWKAYVDASLHSPVAERSASWVAYSELMLGDHDQAIYWLRRANEAHEGDMLWMRNSPMFAGLRGDPRFDSLLIANRLEPIGPGGTPRP